MSALIKVGAVSAVIGGALAIAHEVVNPFLGYPEAGSGDLAMSALYALHVPLFAIALVGFHLRQHREAGRLGLVGFLVALVGMMLLGGIVWSDLFLFPAIEAVAPGLADEPTTSMVIGFILSIAVYAVGWLAFAIATLRAGVFPRPAAVALLVGVVITSVVAVAYVPGVLVVFYGAVTWLGVTTLRRPEPVAFPSPVAA